MVIPFSKRIIGNTLVGYWLCQGWGNAPEKFTGLNKEVERYFSDNGYQQQDKLIDKVLAWDQWHYNLATTPKIIVLDTRTQRWRSESNAGKALRANGLVKACLNCSKSLSINLR